MNNDTKTAEIVKFPGFRNEASKEENLKDAQSTESSAEKIDFIAGFSDKLRQFEKEENKPWYKYGKAAGIAVLAAIGILAGSMASQADSAKFGRYVYALGANSTGARFSGVHTKKIRALVYIVSPIVCAFVGFMLVGYTGTTYLEVGDSYDPSNIAAVILGGTAVTGGRGSYVGTIAGVLIMTILTDFLTILNVNEAIRTMVNGIVLIVLLIAYSRNNTKDV